eukprot:scaffold221629_cov20-Prasinocladus_malaysianus.AAC.1
MMRQTHACVPSSLIRGMQTTTKTVNTHGIEKKKGTRRECFQAKYRQFRVGNSMIKGMKI